MIVFFVRRFPDIEHMVPIINKMIKNGNQEIMVLGLHDRYNIFEDPNIIFIRDKLKVKVDYAYNVYTPTLTHRVLAFLVSSPYRYNRCKNRLENLVKKTSFENLLDLFKQIVVDFCWKFFSKQIDGFKKKRFNFNWAEGFIKQIKPKLLIFDWMKPSKNIVGFLLSVANKLGVPTVAFPHGVFVWTGESWDEDVVSLIGKGYQYDYIVSPDKNSMEIFIKSGIAPEKIYTLGSARFCSEWMRKYADLHQDEEFISKKQKVSLLKVVYMESGIAVLRNKRELIDVVRKIHSLDFVDFILKPKPRSKNLQVPELEFVSQIVKGFSSHVLCKWADVVIMTPTSIYIEALWQNKVFIYPKFLFKQTTIFESMNVGWIVNSYEELEAALRKLKDNPTYKPYSDEAVKNLFIELINGGIKDRDVLGDYRNFILEKSKGDFDS